MNVIYYDDFNNCPLGTDSLQLMGQVCVCVCVCVCERERERERDRCVSCLPCYCSLLLPYGCCLKHNFPWGPVAILRDSSPQYGTSEMSVRVVEDV